MKNVEVARDRIIRSILNNERVAIFSDVDVDGCSSAAIIHNYLRNFIGGKVSFFHSQRSSGHGISTAMSLVPSNVDLLIIVDSSSSEENECKALKQSDIDIVILDHHPMETDNSFAILVNPQQTEDCYPNKSISGSVVAWKTIQAVDDKLNTKYSEDFFDLAALGLLGDQMSMLDLENRFIVREGLEKKNIKNTGLRSLISVFGKDVSNLSATDMLYNVIPAINSACRLDKIEIALSLLTEDDPEIAKKLALKLLELNQDRKKVQSQHLKRLEKYSNLTDKCLIIIDNTIGAGYRGLLAGDLSNKYKKHVIIASDAGENSYKGSLRAYNNFPFKSFVAERIHCLQVAGHESAAGITFKKDDLEFIQKALNEQLPDCGTDNELEYILELNLDDITERLIDDVEEFYRINGNGFGVGLFKINNVFILDREVIGRDQNTLKLSVCPSNYAERNKGWGYDSIDPTHTLLKFRTKEDYITDHYIYKDVSIIGTLNMNVWKNQRTGKVKKTKQVLIEDFRLVF